MVSAFVRATVVAAIALAGFVSSEKAALNTQEARFRDLEQELHAARRVSGDSITDNDTDVNSSIDGTIGDDSNSSINGTIGDDSNSSVNDTVGGDGNSSANDTIGDDPTGLEGEGSGTSTTLSVDEEANIDADNNSDGEAVGVNSSISEDESPDLSIDDSMGNGTSNDTDDNSSDLEVPWGSSIEPENEHFNSASLSGCRMGAEPLFALLPLALVLWF